MDLPVKISCWGVGIRWIANATFSLRVLVLFSWNSRCWVHGLALYRFGRPLEWLGVDSFASREGFEDSMNDDPGREIAVFTEAMKVPAQERAAFLERVCAGDEILRHKVETLLSAQARLGDFLEEPATETTLTHLLHKIAPDPLKLQGARRKGDKKAKMRFQLRPRKRKGKNEN